MDLKRLQQILDRTPGKRVLVVGDLMLDEFIWGKVGRISPEAPVPVVEVTGGVPVTVVEGCATEPMYGVIV